MKHLHFLTKSAGGLRIMKAAMLLFVVMMLMPQNASAKCIFPYNDNFLPGPEGNKVTWNAGTGTISFWVCIYNWEGCDGGFNSCYVQLSLDGSNYENVFWCFTNYYGDYQVAGWDGTELIDRGSNMSQKSYTCSAGSAKCHTYMEGEKRWAYVTITLNLQWRNSTIYVKANGEWWHYHSDYMDEKYGKVQNSSITTPYTHTVRPIEWNGDYTIYPDGTVTIPYKFGAACNTDGYTHLCTSINGSYSSQIGIKSLSGYSAGSYSFKLSDIGKSFTEEFTIQPYHEFTHEHDKDANNNGRKNYISSADRKTFLPLPVATIENAAFSQQNKNVVLTWKASNTNYGSGKWAIYRNGQKIAVVDRNTTTYTDTSIPYEQKVTYEVYFLMSNWDENTKVNELKSKAFDAETNRTLPVKHFNAESKSDRIVLTWESDKYPANWGNKFKIYVDNELVYTITPAKDQDTFRWEHRDTNTHTDRVNGHVGDTLYYTEERLNGAVPHNYRVEGVIGDKVFDKDSAMYRGIGNGTTFYSLDASKNAYAGQVKLSWHVDRQGSTQAQTYIVERQTAEQKKDVWTTLTRFSSTDDYLFYTDDTPLPGVCYKYHVKVQDERSDGAILEDDITDIGFAQASGTISGRITYGTTGMAVQGVDVVAAPIGNDVAKHYHSMRFTGHNGELKWTYPSATYANETFNTNPWSIQMWVNPDSIQQQRLIGFKKGKSYEVYDSVVLVNERQIIIDSTRDIIPRYIYFDKECVQGTYDLRQFSDYNRYYAQVEADFAKSKTWFDQYIQMYNMQVLQYCPLGSACNNGYDCKITEEELLHLQDSLGRQIRNRFCIYNFDHYDSVYRYEYATIYDTVTYWKVREVSSQDKCWLGMNNLGQLVLYNNTLPTINGEAPVAGRVYNEQPTTIDNSSIYTFGDLVIQPRQYSHLTLTRSGNTLTAYVTTTGEDGLPLVQSAQVTLTGDLDLNNATQFSLGGFTGYVDEFRLWTKCLTQEEIKENYNHLLVGDEANLETYWSFDEGLSTRFFDYSREGTVYHSHHGIIGGNAESSDYFPSQLALRATTDNSGNYIIRGVPFSGEGTTYAVIPTLGIHEFNPTQQLRYVSANSLVHNSTDFDDVSSFPVSGTVYYAGTNYPVEGCNLYVDGQPCSKDGELIETNAYGQYTISVPIGEHFIQVKKQGHEFVSNGRYPAQAGKYVNFDREIKNLTFYDSTLVNFTGRVAGGDVEGDKPVGFGQSKNNIGMATLTLIPRNIENTNYYINAILPTEGTVIQYEPNPDRVALASASPDTIHSKAWRGGGSADECQKFYIRTDSLTGEFSALLPPLDYLISSIHVASSPELDSKIMESPIAVDMTNPQMAHKDSVRGSDSTMQYYEYHAMLRQTYHSEPTFSVVQRGHEDGSFGIDSIEIEDALGTLKLNDIHHIDTVTGDLVYTYGYPLFQTMETYTFDLQGYEEYLNREKNITSTVPLAYCVVTIDNELSAEQEVYVEDNPDGAEPGSVNGLKSNQLRLDSAGHATYSWYGGLPNKSGNHTRTLNIYFGENKTPWTGNPLRGILLGSIQRGHNFITGGDINVDMILRDPPGSQSFATWETGTITTERTYVNTSATHNHTSNDCTTCNDNWYLDFSLGIGTDFGTNGAFSASIPLVNATLKKDRTKETLYQATSSTTITASTTVTEAISTSANPEYDGPDADLFIGSATNYIIGETDRVDLYRDPADTTKAVIDVQDAIGLGVSFETEFVYSRHHIEHTLIPELIATRNSLLTPGVDTTNVTPDATRAKYATPLQKTAKDYGENGTYKIVPPSNFKGSYFTDSVSMFNKYINDWKVELMKEEEEKIHAFSDRDVLSQQNKMTNLSYDAGASVSMTQTVTNERAFTRDTLRGITIHYHSESGAAFLGLIGRKREVDDVATADTTHTYENDTVHTTTFSYTLQDNDAGDALTVDVYNYGAYGPIFRTRGGQTSNPYEGEVQTKYYNPGTTIMESTARVDYPLIDAEPRTQSNVPSGSSATYELRLKNWSEVGAERPYRLFVDDTHNPNGAQLFIDGMPLTDGRVFRIPGNGQDVVKTLQLKQSDVSVLDYDSIGIIFASLGQSDPMSGMPIIADTVYINAYFVPSSSPVTLAVNTNTVNTHTDTVLVLTMKDFDRNFYNLKAFRMQYKQQGGKWTDLHEYVLNGEQLSSIQQLLPDSMPVVYRLSMKNAMSWPDGTYTFRIVSVSTYGAEEVYVYSNEQTVIKDTSYPRPLGQAQPADGVLEIGDELSITYNMPFLSGSLTPENFLVTGVLNGAQVEHLTALHAFNDTTAATARTEANINLSGKEYSLDAWFYIQSEGVLLSHGVDKQKMTIATNEQGQMVISFADSVYTSAAAVPRNKWVFFTLSREVETGSGLMNVSIAYDDTIQSIFADKTVPLYYGNGPVAVGGGAITAVHELLLWDEARDITTALYQRSVTKSPSTRHLIGYWKMNEGEGKSIRDYARNRHMIMRDESWYLNNINKAVALDGTQHIAVCTANVPPLPQDDYAMEMWLQSGAQADTAQLMQLGDISLWLDPNGQLHLQSGTSQWAMTNHPSPITNSDWHHVMLNVRRYGTAAVYIDGERALTVSASAIGSFASDSLIVGARRTLIAKTDTTVAYYRYDRHFTGSVDEIRLWKTTIASDMLASKRKLRLNGDEPGLLLYYPFEKKQLDEYSQIVTDGTLEEMTGHGTEATIANSQQPTANSQFRDDAPALKEKPTQTNVSFSFTASDTKIVIDIDEEPAVVDGCTLNFTVRDVRSVNGNNSLPATWSAFIHRNELAWLENDLTIVKQVDETVTVTAAIINRSGTPQRWYLSELPASLTASSTSGMLNPLEKATITFRINSTAPLGKHERTIYAMGSNGVPTPLTLHVKVTGEIPDWSVNPADYETSMNVISQLDFFGHISDDEDDIVAAFIGDECRGVAKSEYKERYDGFYQTLTVYGNPGDEGQPVTFQAYRASTGVYYTSVTPSRTVTYTPMNIIGRYDESVLMSVNDLIVQRTTLKKGWNWISFLTEATDMTPQTVFAEIAKDVEAIKGHQDESQGIDVGFMLRTDTGWVGYMDTLLNRRSYMVKMKKERELYLVGKGITPATHLVRIHENWGWPGYYGLHRISIANALAGADPQNGDMVRTQSAAAYFDDYEWVGSLQTLEPGQGYAYYSVTDEDKWFAYPSSSVAAAPRRNEKMRKYENKKMVNGQMVNDYAYPYNMILVGQVLLDNQPAANAEVGIFDGDECRSVGYTDAQGLLLMLVAGEEEATLCYKLVLNDHVYETVETLHYLTDAIVGTPDAPHIIRFGAGQGTGNVQRDDVQCTKVLRDGILFIERNGRTYTATGAEVK